MRNGKTLDVKLRRKKGDTYETSDTTFSDVQRNVLVNKVLIQIGEASGIRLGSPQP